MTGGFEKEPFRELYRFKPLLRSEGKTPPPGAATAPDGMTWTLIGFSDSDAEVFSSWERKLAKDGKDHRKFEEKSRDEIDSGRRAIMAMFPAAGDLIGNPKPWGFGWVVRFDFTESPDVNRKKFPIEVWLLLDPKDGYFQLVKGPIDLDKIERQMR